MAIWWWELSYRVGPNLWVVPLLMAGATLGVFALTRRMDALLADRPDGLAAWLLPEWLTARTTADAVVVLSAMMAALATALALVFSTSILTFSLASTQLGPRLIRRFMQDPVTQLTLGAFLAAFIFCTLTLGSVRTGPGAHVPQASFAVAVLSGVACFVVLIVYVHRVATTIQAPKVVSAVVGDLARTLDEEARFVSARMAADADEVVRVTERVQVEGTVVTSLQSGYVQGVDHLRLLAMAERHQGAIVLLSRPGQFVLAGAPLARVTPVHLAEHLERVVHHAVEIGAWRTRRQDVEYAVNQVVEIALRALSPAINDTFTGLTCIDWLAAALCNVGRSPVQSGGMCSGDGEVRLFQPPLRFERLVRASYDLIRQAGATNPAVLIRLFDAVATMADVVDGIHLSALEEQCDLVLATALHSGAVGQDAEDISDRHREAVAALARRRAEVP